MTDEPVDRKKPGSTFWLTMLLIGLPGLYIASFGPVCWIASRTGDDSSQWFATAYWPVWLILEKDIPIVAPVLEFYALIGVPLDGGLTMPINPTIRN